MKSSLGKHGPRMSFAWVRVVGFACVFGVVGTSYASAQELPACRNDLNGPDRSQPSMRTRSQHGARVYSCSYRATMPANQDNMVGSEAARAEPSRDVDVVVHAIRVEWRGTTFEIANSINWRAWPSVRVERHGNVVALTLVESAEYYCKTRTTRFVVVAARGVLLDTVLRECEDDGQGWTCGTREPVSWQRDGRVAVGRGNDREFSQLP